MEDGTGTTPRSRHKTVSIDDARAHDELRPWLIGLLAAATTGQEDDEIEAAVDLVLKASTRRSAINLARKRVAKGPSRREHARVLESLDLAVLEKEVNKALQAYARPYLPKGRVEVAVDFNDQPYHGRPHRNENEVRRSQAKSGTTWFHTFATLYVVADGKRYTVLVRFVRKGETPTTVLKLLLTHARSLGFTPTTVYADKAFCTREGLRWLRDEGFRAIVPLPLRGKKAKALCRGRGSRWARHTFGGRGEALTVRVAVVVKRNQLRSRVKYHGRKPGNQYFPYVVIGFGSAGPRRIDRWYRNRGGIESSYKLVNQARPRTSSRNPAIRVLYYAVALFAQNAWVHLRWLVSQPRRGRGGRTAPKGFFPFDEFLELLAARIRHEWGETLVIRQLPAVKR